MTWSWMRTTENSMDIDQESLDIQQKEAMDIDTDVDLSYDLSENPQNEISQYNPSFLAAPQNIINELLPSAIVTNADFARFVYAQSVQDQELKEDVALAFERKAEVERDEAQYLEDPDSFQNYRAF
ncbi:hypothetical protein HYALB_00009447 [Hymenoscyphus albidus]|uniref:Uncharacterized protein n=1 Tax=Hymenoscyphus albidus TaxID=595503 RepID=A0A9N9Q960_9HELO|nr:hypothetical protein HYALB_00009447 [Hymenoscyphus albidus]